MVDQLNEACARHEAQHQRDIRAALGDGGPSLKVTECMAKLNLAPAELKELEARWNSNVSASLQSVVNDAKEALHKTANGKPIPLSSRLCDTCFSDFVRLELKIFANTDFDMTVSFNRFALRSLVNRAPVQPTGPGVEAGSDGPGMTHRRNH